MVVPPPHSPRHLFGEVGGSALPRVQSLYVVRVVADPLPDTDAREVVGIYLGVVVPPVLDGHAVPQLVREHSPQGRRVGAVHLSRHAYCAPIREGAVAGSWELVGFPVLDGGYPLEESPRYEPLGHLVEGSTNAWMDRGHAPG